MAAYLKIKFKSLDREQAIERATAIIKRYQGFGAGIANPKHADTFGVAVPPRERIEVEVWDGEELVWTDKKGQ